MKIKITKRDALPVLHAFAHVAKGRHTIALLGCVLFDVGEVVSAVVTDLEQELTAIISAVTEESGRCAIPLERLQAILERLPDDDVMTIACSGHEAAKITSKGRRFSVGTLSHEDFPIMAARETVAEATVLSDDLRSVLSAVDFAAAKDDVRFYLNGVFLRLAGSHLHAVASNGHMLAVAERVCAAVGDGGVPAGDTSVIIPRDAVRTILRKAHEPGQPVTLRFGEQFLAVVSAEGAVAIRGIDGTYPDYKRIIPDGGDSIAILAVDELLAAVQAAAICGEVVQMDFSKDAVKITGAAIGGDLADVGVSARHSGADLSIRASAKYLIGILSAIGCQNVRISMTGPMSAMLLEDADDSASLKYVLMPVR